LIFTSQAGENSIDVIVVDANVWLTQDMFATLYEKGRSKVRVKGPVPLTFIVQGYLENATL